MLFATKTLLARPRAVSTSSMAFSALSLPRASVASWVQESTNESAATSNCRCDGRVNFIAVGFAYVVIASQATTDIPINLLETRPDRSGASSSLLEHGCVDPFGFLFFESTNRLLGAVGQANRQPVPQPPAVHRD